MSKKPIKPVNKKAVLITNIILMAISIAAIVTLLVGNFWTVDFALNLDGSKLTDLMGSMGGGETPGGTPDGDPGSGSMPGSGSAGEDQMVSTIMSELNLKISIPLNFEGMQLINAAIGGDAAKEAANIVNSNIDLIVDNLVAQVPNIVGSVTKSVVSMTITAAEDKLLEELQAAAPEGETITKEDVSTMLEEEYGVTDQDVTELKDAVAEAGASLVNGDVDAVKNILLENEVLTKILAAQVESSIAENNPDYTPQQVKEAAEAQANEVKAELALGMDEMIAEFVPEGEEFNQETLIVGIISSAGLAPEGEDGTPQEITSIEDVKTMIKDLVTDMLSGENAEGSSGATDAIGMILKILGIFILVVVGGWAYFLLKLIVKTLFAKHNKTVRMFFPKLLGWMPHVIFVGLPMFLVKNLSKILQLVQEKANLDLGDMSESIDSILGMFTLDITSLTWVSALCVLLITVIGFVYHKWRRRLKKLKRQEKRAARAAKRAA